MGMILAMFAQGAQGPAAAVQVLRGMVLGLYSFAAFFFMLRIFLSSGAGAGVAYSAAAVLGVQVQALWLLRLRKR